MLYTPTAIRDRSAVTLDIAKAHLRILPDDTTFDTILTIYLQAAKEKADVFCQNNFTRSGVDQDIPLPVDVWIMQQVSKMFNQSEPNVTRASIESNMETHYDISYEVDYTGLLPYRLEWDIGIY